jgi:polysaccharide pyruvyl transferase WcaK-like protein
MIFNRFWKPPLGLLQAFVLHNKPFGLYGQSFDGFTPGNEEEELKRLLSKAAFIFCRDGESLEFLRSKGVTPAVLEFGPDGCFGIDVRADEKAGAYLERHGLIPKEFITVTLRTNTPKSKGGGDPLNPAHPRPEELAQAERWAASLREVITKWVGVTGKKVLLAPEVDREIEPAKRLLFDPLPAEIRSKVVHRDTFWNVDEAASIYARAHTVVSMEPHSCIIALANGTPTLHLFSGKHGVKAGMFRDVGLPEWLLNIDALPPQRAVDALLKVEADYARSERKVGRAMAFVNQRSAEMAGDIRRLLGL